MVVASASISYEYGEQTRATVKSRSLISSAPTHDVSETTSPCSRPWRASSVTVTSAGFVWVIDATRHDCGGSPSASATVHASPKSQKSAAQTPRASAATKHAPSRRHAASTAASSASEAASQTATQRKPFTRAAHSAASAEWSEPAASPAAPGPITVTRTYGFRSASRAAQTSARGLPTSAGVTYGLPPRSRHCTGVGSNSATPLTPARITFLASSAPTPVRPATSTVADDILAWPSRPST
mmetsp:Transcript_6697/g.21081  ORF Transcript_6697/g.21081 Transcript_6697/m.21081 type:complete len:241 (+) Transcript_6697:2387-3109(+)